MKKFAKTYLDILTGPLKGINLTRILEPEDFYNKQIFDSVYPLELSGKFNASVDTSSVVIDVGFGGGFPLVPMASLKPEQSFIGLESKNKKAEAVSLICEKMNISNVRAIHGRVEDYEIDINATIIFKAVGKIPDCLALLNVTAESQVYFYKGPALHEQEEVKKLGRSIIKIEEKSFELPDGSQRILIGYKVLPVPRGTNKKKNTKKNLVKISALKTKLFQ